MRPDHLPDIHPVDVVGGEDRHPGGLEREPVFTRFSDGVRRAPEAMRRRVGAGQDNLQHTTAAREQRRPVSAQMLDQRVRLVLRQHDDPADAGVGEIGDCEIHDPRGADEGHGGLALEFGQGSQATAFATGEHDCHRIEARAFVLG